MSHAIQTQAYSKPRQLPAVSLKEKQPNMEVRKPQKQIRPARQELQQQQQHPQQHEIKRPSKRKQPAHLLYQQPYQSKHIQLLACCDTHKGNSWPHREQSLPFYYHLSAHKTSSTLRKRTEVKYLESLLQAEQNLHLYLKGITKRGSTLQQKPTKREQCWHVRRASVVVVKIFDSVSEVKEQTELTLTQTNTVYLSNIR